MKPKPKDHSLSRELRYASHHHLIPLYIISGLAVLGVLVLGCFLAVLWQNDDRDSYLPAAHSAVSNLENLYLEAVIAPAEKKQYVFPVNTRFAMDDAYTDLRYAYDPGTTGNATGGTIVLTSSRTLQDLEAPVLRNPKAIGAYSSHLQQCARLYVIRFEPGLSQYGGFAPLREVKLKDGRTAYIHKNTACVPRTTEAMTTLDKIEKTVASIESY